MSYYPEGVSGSEYAIAGPDGYMNVEVNVELCDHELPDGNYCQFSGEVLVIDAAYYREEIWGTLECPDCHHRKEWESTLDKYL
jgi:hypothetical protein